MPTAGESVHLPQLLNNAIASNISSAGPITIAFLLITHVVGAHETVLLSTHNIIDNKFWLRNKKINFVLRTFN